MKRVIELLKLYGFGSDRATRSQIPRPGRTGNAFPGRLRFKNGILKATIDDNVVYFYAGKPEREHQRKFETADLEGIRDYLKFTYGR